mmetsp:Transcript_7090/g.11224  ORF Transcript_7090/g.11224 Transcript_7090/m.11224 type:complete len:774 (-) Transcript_7090:103-2424(-)
MSLADHHEPTSTTKALLVMIIAPRHVAAEKKETLDIEKNTKKDNGGVIESKLRDKKHEGEANNTKKNNLDNGEKAVENASNDREDGSKMNKPTNSTKGGSIDNIKERDSNRAPQSDEQLIASETPNPDLVHAHNAETPARSNKKTFFTEKDDENSSRPATINEISGNVENSGKEDETSKCSTAESNSVSAGAELSAEVVEEVTPEEAALVVLSNEDPDISEVNVEELIRLTMKGLLEEWHLLTVPTITRTNQKWFLTATGTEDSECVQVQFMAKPTSLAAILDRLERIGIGTNCGNVSVYRAELCRSTSSYAHRPIDDSTSLPPGPPSITRHPDISDENDIEDNWSRVTVEARIVEDAKKEWKNAATRLRIEQVREQIAEQQAWTFDFLSLLCIASMLAAIGLVTNSVTVIVASMLVSPIMGPVLGLTFGSKIRDWPLVKSSLRNELMALLFCILIGALAGLIASFTSIAEDWPTNEMETRGQVAGLISGIAIAIPSGMGVCLSVLGGNTSSLVGVAISASLLPPAVNAGLCLVYSLLLSTGAVSKNDYKTAPEFLEIAGISFLLTVVNIICIWLSGLLMFEIKEVSKFEKKAAFWANDLKMARELNKGSNGEKPAPVNIELIRRGLQSAAKHRPYHSERGFPTAASSLRYDRQCSSERDATQHSSGRPPLTSIHVGSARSLKPISMYTSSSRLDDVFPLRQENPPVDQREGGFLNMINSVFNGWGGNDDSEEDDDEHVGLDDMGKLLGFDENEDCNMDHERIAQNIGKGRYI